MVRWRPIYSYTILILLLIRNHNTILQEKLFERRREDLLVRSSNILERNIK
jgi:hypothetical protein